MKKTPRWQEIVRQTAGQEQPSLPWASAASRQSCRLRVEGAACAEPDRAATPAA